MRKRTVYILLTVMLFLCVLTVPLYLYHKAAPKAARLLPESDAILYLNLRPLRAATHFDRSSITPSPSYQRFIDATGIVAERDLDSAAVALHRMGDPSGPNGTVAYSEVFEGRFDSGRLTRYLTAVSTSQETYAGHVVYSIPSEGRTMRFAVLGSDMVAGSNMPTTEHIHSILDRQRASASPFAGSSLLDAFYKDVPALSAAWAIGQIGLPFAENGRVAVGGMELPVAADSTFVGSVGVSGLHPGSVAVRVDQIAPDEAAAGRTAQALNGLLSLLRAVQPAARTPSEFAVRQIVDSVRIEQHGVRTSLTATLPRDALRTIGAYR